MSRKQHSDNEEATPAVSDKPTELTAFELMVESVAGATKKLCDAGMGAPAAGALACEMYCKAFGIKTPD